MSNQKVVVIGNGPAGSQFTAAFLKKLSSAGVKVISPICLFVTV